MSTAHSVPRSSRKGRSTLTVAAGGQYAKLYIPQLDAGRVGGGIKQKISGFSRASGRKLLALVNSIDREAIEPDRIFFGTLTYPYSFVGPLAAKRHFAAFAKRFERRFGQMPYLWKLEPQERGAPHLHLLIFADHPDQLEEMQTWVANNWHDIAGGGDPLHLLWHLGKLRDNKPCVERIRSWDGVASYTSKYFAKEVDWERFAARHPDWQHPGRWWGKRHVEQLPIHLVEFELDEEETILYRRQLRRFIQHQPTGRLRVEDPDNGKVQRPWKLTPSMIEQLRRLGYSVRHYHRRHLVNLGGISCFLSESSALRLLDWCKRAVVNVNENRVGRPFSNTALWQRRKSHERISESGSAGVSTDRRATPAGGVVQREEGPDSQRAARGPAPGHDWRERAGAP